MLLSPARAGGRPEMMADEALRMSVLQVLLVIILYLSVVTLAFLANRRFGSRRQAAERTPSEDEMQWLKELSTLRLEERHPCC